ncbi:MAG: cation transporter [Rhodanobacteraceae bacterium]|nr:MAG: cation transporter [Rhodanobacteraceae bacterium]
MSDGCAMSHTTRDQSRLLARLRRGWGDPARSALRIAFIANLAMFAIGLIGWAVADSTALLADAFDMLVDASAFVFAYLAVGRSRRLQKLAARWSSVLLVALGLGVIAEVVEHWLHGSEPLGLAIVGFSLLSLVVNGGVLALLSGYRHASEVQLRAAWRDARADILVNIGVLLSGVAIALTGYRYIDLAVGLVISAFVIHEGIEIWGDASRES